MEVGISALGADLLSSLEFRSPEPQGKIFKDECMKCFNTPFHPGGLFVYLNTFADLCQRHIYEHCSKTGHKTCTSLYIQSTPVEKPVTEGSDDKATKLANGVKVATSGWKCAEPQCGLTENLWLNLTDGTVKCGRVQFLNDGEVSKGNNHMRHHYERHILTKMESNQAPGEASILDALRFKVETRLEDFVSKRVRYEYSDNTILSLSIEPPLEGDDLADRDGKSLISVRTLEECLKKTFTADPIDDYKSPLTGEHTGGALAYGIATFPDFLIVHMKKFDVLDYTVQKLDVFLAMPDVMDLESFKARGKQPEEVLLPPPPKTAEESKAPVVPDDDTLGFSKDSKLNIIV